MTVIRFAKNATREQRDRFWDRLRPKGAGRRRRQRLRRRARAAARVRTVDQKRQHVSMKYRLRRGERDFDFYLRNADRFTFCGGEIEPIPHAKDGCTALEAFIHYESTGNIPVTRQPGMLRRVMLAKASFQFHITALWSKGMTEGNVVKHEMKQYFSRIDAPKWAMPSLVGMKNNPWESET